MTAKAPAPQLERRKRRTEETRGGFKLAAVNVMGHRVRLPAAAYEAAAYISHTLDWLNPWHHDTDNSSEVENDFHHQETTNHFSPHL